MDMTKPKYKIGDIVVIECYGHRIIVDGVTEEENLYAGKHWVEYEKNNYKNVPGFEFPCHYQALVQFEIEAASYKVGEGFEWEYRVKKNGDFKSIYMNGYLPEGDIEYKLC
jgi:hypothetical protein